MIGQDQRISAAFLSLPQLRDAPGGGVEGEVVGFDIDHASRQLDLTTLEAVELPLKATRLA